jgi:hypothetical protein
MGTVNFECGHCHSLMAVGEEHLGQQVRCPHCQQIVLAPAPAPPPGPVDLASLPPPPPYEEPGSIFEPAEAAAEDLFGGVGAPRIEIPTEPAAPRIEFLQPTVPDEGASAPPPLLTPDQPTLTYAGPEPPPPEASATEVSPANGAASPSGRQTLLAVEEPTPAPTADGVAPLHVEPRVRPARGGGWVIAIVIVPLISYSILATIAIILLLTQIRDATHPLEMIPDIEGDHKGGATRGGRHGSVEIRMPDPAQSLPSRLRVPLATPPQTLAVGDLDVTPLKVERGPLAWSLGPGTQQFSEDVLILTLKLRNRSRDVTLFPMDRYFVRAWSKKPGDMKPYTMLEIGARRFYGGALDWSRKNEYIKGQDVNRELKPGEEMTTFICTNPEEHALKALDSYDGRLLWRVQLRRGLVRWTTRDGVEREDPATAVIGVEFTPADVQDAD